MKRMLVVFVLELLLLGFTAWAADSQVVGKWDCKSLDQEGHRLSWTLVVKDNGGKLSASLTGADGYEIPVAEPKVAGNAFIFKIVVNPQETIVVRTTLAGNRLAGTFKGKEAGTGKFTGVKQG